MPVGSGLEEIHRLKKRLKVERREIAALEKKLESASGNAPSWEIRVIERKLFEAQLALSLTEKNLSESWS